MKLHELREEYSALLAAASSADDPAIFEDTINGLVGEVQDKIHACCVVIRTLGAEAEALKAEEERLYSRRKAVENNADRLRAYMTVEMDLMGLPSVRTPFFSVSIQANKAKLVVTDETTIPAVYWRQVSKLDNEALRAAIERGEHMEGAFLQPSKSVRIR